jgi:uncharacterized phage protein gp47/JayE
MAVIFPSDSDEVVDAIRTDVKGELPDSNPWLESGWIPATVVGLGKRLYDMFFQLKESIKEAFPNTATGEYLQFWGDLKRLTLNSATPSSGKVTLTGTPTTNVPAATVIVLGSVEYTLDNSIVLATIAKTVDTLTQSGGTAVCLTDDDHEFATGNTITIAGAVQTEYNGTHTITVTGLKTFTFTVAAGAVSPATGTITASIDGQTGEITASVNGTGTNAANGAELELQNSIAGVDDTVTAQYDGLTGGTDNEEEEDYQGRVVYAWQNPLTPFNAANIEKVAKSVNGVTRVFVKEVTPAVGQVTTYFVRDNDETIIPDATEVSNVKAALENIRPSNTEPDDNIVSACTGISINVDISSITPDTLTMRDAIENTIDAYYRGGIDEGEDNEVDKLKSAIYQTYDVVRGEQLQSFTLDAPTTDTTIAEGEIAIAGTVVVVE